MVIQQNVSLLPYNTFGMDVPAEYLLELRQAESLPELSADTRLPQVRRVLGGGSNVLLTGPVKGLVLLNRMEGIEKVREDEAHVWLQVQAGTIWHKLVLHAIRNRWGGIENLALIPGTVGAAPIQNIGAYGIEIKETLESVTAWHWGEQAFITLSNSDCRFGYRDSIFKHELKDQVVITSVLFRLSKQPVFRTDYGALTHELKAMHAEPSIGTIAQAVMNIRSSKLPDPAQIGNAGSFFKNPGMPKEQFLKMKEKYPDLPSYPVTETAVKIPAGWLIEHCWWKGHREGDAGVHKKQALVLVNYGHATGAQIWALSDKIVQSVKEKFGIELEREVQVW